MDVYMEHNLPMNLFYVLTLFIWFGVAVLYVFLRVGERKVVSAKTADDLVRFRYATAKKGARVVKIFYKISLVTLVIASVLFVTGIILRTIYLFCEDMAVSLTLGQMLLWVVKPFSLLYWLTSLGGYVGAYKLYQYHTVLHRKCSEMGLSDE